MNLPGFDSASDLANPRSVSEVHALGGLDDSEISRNSARDVRGLPSAHVHSIHVRQRHARRKHNSRTQRQTGNRPDHAPLNPLMFRLLFHFPSLLLAQVRILLVISVPTPLPPKAW